MFDPCPLLSLFFKMEQLFINLLNKNDYFTSFTTSMQFITLLSERDAGEEHS